jgi:hypothetical protein
LFYLVCDKIVVLKKKNGGMGKGEDEEDEERK